MNRLADAVSPYLLQHAGNPVDWWPWGEAAFAEARRRDVPVFLSVGYATCHWCHVMAHESFEHAPTAAMLNRAFVCVKLDREERPDVDALMMDACLALNGSGGWPLTALLTPDTREPFYVATYLPRESRGGRIGVQELASNVARFWAEDPDGVRRSASGIADHVRGLAKPETHGALGEAHLERAAASLLRRYDAAHGGFGLSPKFPTPHHAGFLAREAVRRGGPALAAPAVATLRAIRRGGIWDHVGGGIHRYATDRVWLVPHFEKMLYDQAGLATAALDAFAATGEPDLAEIARETLDAMLRDFALPCGAFASAWDADSPGADGHSEEGAFTVWTEAELAAVLGADAAFARAAFGTTPEGTYRDEATGALTGANVLHHPAAPDDLARTLGLSRDAFDARLADVVGRLRSARAERPPPLLDDKVLADWNGWACAALARGAVGLGEPRYADTARRALDWIDDTMRDADGALVHRARTAGGETEVGIPAMLGDYAFLALARLELYQAQFRTADLVRALDLFDTLDARFSVGDLWATSTADDLLAAPVELDDGAMPSAHSAAALVAVRLARLTGRADLEARAARAQRAPDATLERPDAATFWLTAVGWSLASREVVVAGPDDAAAAFVDAVRAAGALTSDVLRVRPGDAEVARLAPFAAGLLPATGAVGAVCRDGACGLPTAAPGEVAARLAG